MTLLDELTALLSDADLRPQLDPSALTQPFALDGTYNATLVGLGFHFLGRRRGDQTVVRAELMRFSTFLAARPHLLPDFEAWRRAFIERRLDLSKWPLLPRGYLSDPLHNRVLTFLASAGEVVRDSNQVVLSLSATMLSELVSTILADDMFRSERYVFQALKNQRLSVRMLGYT